MIKITYDEDFKVTGIGNQENFITTEPFILLDLTDEEYEHLLNTPFKKLMVDIEHNSIASSLIPEKPIDEVSDIEKLKKEIGEIKEVLDKIKTLLER